MSVPEVEQNFVKDKRMQMIEKRKPGTSKGKDTGLLKKL